MFSPIEHQQLSSPILKVKFDHQVPGGVSFLQSPGPPGRGRILRHSAATVVWASAELSIILILDHHVFSFGPIAHYCTKTRNPRHIGAAMPS